MENPYNKILLGKKKKREKWNKMEDYGTMKDANHKRPHIVWLHSWKCPVIGKSKQTEGRLVVARRCAEEGLGSGWYRDSFFGDDKNIWT